jgi:hypothetical protein
MNKKDNSIITTSELFAEIEKFKMEYKHIYQMTDEQFNTITLLRDPPNKVKWEDITKFWNKKGWGEITWEALYQRYKKEKRLRQQDVD